MRGTERLRLYIDDDQVFNQPATQLGEIEVTAVLPLALIRSKDAHFQAGITPSRPKDIHRKQALIERFYPGEDPASDKFNLRISKI